MPPERRPTNYERFIGPHENAIRDLGKLLPPNIDFFRKKFEAGEFAPSDAYFIGTWLIHTQNGEHLGDSIILGLAYLSQAVELDPRNPRYRWALRHEKRTHVITVQGIGDPSKNRVENDEALLSVAKPPVEENFLDYAEIARYREGNKKIKPEPRKRARRDRRKKRSIWSY